VFNTDLPDGWTLPQTRPSSEWLNVLLVPPVREARQDPAEEEQCETRVTSPSSARSSSPHLGHV
jgi:hypothetical protein